MYIDTHAHLNFEPFVLDPEPYVQRARDYGVEAVIIPAVDLRTAEAAIGLAERFPELYAAVGVHPHDCAAKDTGYLKELESLASHPRVVAIGEIGMDFFRDYAPAELQMRTFREQIALAKSLDMPMIVHDRAADEAVREALAAEDYYRMQAHCYTGGADFALELIARGALISFTNVITFSRELPQIVAALGPDRLMIETDAPFMAPKPWRGKTCEPFMVHKVAEKYAEIFKLPLSEVAEMTTARAREFFRI